jgi:hypothetical protein
MMKNYRTSRIAIASEMDLDEYFEIHAFSLSSFLVRVKSIFKDSGQGSILKTEGYLSDTCQETIGYEQRKFAGRRLTQSR